MTLKLQNRMSPGMVVILVGAAGNLLLSAIKFVGGWVGGSPALITDAFHSLSDLATDGVALLTYKLGRMPRDDNHPYGHGKAESIGASSIGLLIILAGMSLAYYSFGETSESLEHFTTSDAKSFSWASPMMFALLCGVASILINEGLYRYTRRVGEQEHSPALIANAWHHRSDALSSVAAVVGIAGHLAGYAFMDPLAGVIVSVMIVKAGGEIVREGFRDLMDTALENEELEKLIETARTSPGVLSIHDARSRRMGGAVYMDLHIQVDPECSVSEGHQVGERVRRRLIHLYEQVSDVLVHVDTEGPADSEPIYEIEGEEVRALAQSVLHNYRKQMTCTRKRLHFHDGEVTLEVFLRPAEELSPEKYFEQGETIRCALESIEKINTARVFLDLES